MNALLTASIVFFLIVAIIADAYNIKKVRPERKEQEEYFRKNESKDFRSLIVVAFLLINLSGYSQMHAEMGAGYSHNPIANISIGYTTNNIVTEAVMQPSLTREVNSNNYFSRLLLYGCSPGSKRARGIFPQERKQGF